MFKAPTKKRKQLNILSKSKQRYSNESENDSENDKKRKRPKKKSSSKGKKVLTNSSRSAGAISFAMDDEQDENTSIGDNAEKRKVKKKKKKTKKRSGLGFGGLSYAEEDEEGPAIEIKMGRGVSSFQHDDYENEQDNEEAGTPSLYDKRAMEKLKSEQKAFIPKETQELNEPLADTVKTEKAGPLSDNIDSSKTEDNVGFIPLDSRVIMTGDDAIAYANDEEDRDNHYDKNPRGKDSIEKAKLGTEVLSNLCNNKAGDFTRNLQKISEGTDNQDEMDIDEGGKKWEEEIARRAGVGSNRDRKTESHHSASKAFPRSDDDGRAAITKIKKTIESNIDHLIVTDQDLESSIGRQRHECEVSKEELTKHEEDLSSAGIRFDFFSALRMDLVNWVGALRQMKDSIKQIEEALLDFHRDLAARDKKYWKDLEDDIISILEEEHLLKTVLGRKPDSFQRDSSSVQVVDEFGRDLGSLKSRGRSKRMMHRRRARQEGKDRHSASNTVQYFEDTDGELSDNEVLDRGDRRHALSDAVKVILDDLEDEYTSVSSLISIFKKFQSSYPHEYRQCYANLSLSDLISVLVRAELCMKMDFSHLMNGDGLFHDGSLQSFPWYDELVKLDKNVGERNDLDKESSNEDTGALGLLVENVFFNSFSFALKGEAFSTEKNFYIYNPFSEKQTKAMTTMFNFITRTNLREKNSAKNDKLKRSVLDYIADFLGHIAFPLVDQSALKIISEEPRNECDDRINAVTYATIGQLFRLKKLLLNVVKYWGRVFDGTLNDDLANFCLLDIVSYRFLPILETVESDNGSKLFEEALSIFKNVIDVISEANWMHRSNLMLSSAPLRAAQSKYNII